MEYSNRNRYYGEKSGSYQGGYYKKVNISFNSELWI
jgi:hypothetical protein